MKHYQSKGTNELGYLLGTCFGATIIFVVSYLIGAI